MNKDVIDYIQFLDMLEKSLIQIVHLLYTYN